MPKISYWNIMTRRKPMPTLCDNEESKLGRVFSTFDLTALGVSATLGVGVYVLAGHVAKLEAGPSVILSFAIAAAASFLAGLCYAEFASRVPKSGSAYIFTYVAIGEFVAFIIGWNLLLEYIIGSASIAKGLSLYIDSLVDNSMKNYFKTIAPLDLGSFLSSYFDFFAFGGPLLLGLALAFGLRKSAGMNNIFCMLNLGVVLYVVITVIMNANLDYWRIDPKMVPEEYRNATGAGGFFPFGFSGTIKGAATCFFGFVGFDCIATTGEEVRNPRKAVPRAILFSLIIIFLAYFGVALLTLMWPYYLLDVDAPLPHAFHEIGWETSKWIVTIGGIVGLIASLFGAMFPLPRILYAMSMDGLIFKEFGIISERFQTPVIGTLCAASLTSCFAGLFDLAALVNMLSIGVLLAYTVVAISIIVLRFSHPTTPLPITNGNGANETSNLLRPGYNITTKGFFMQLFRFKSSNRPNNISMTVVCVMIACYCIVSLALALLISYRIDSIIAGETWTIVALSVLALTLFIFCLLISIQPKQVFNTRTKPFMVPIVPFLPAMSVFINIYLMLMLDCYTWIRFGIWMIVGIFVYFPSTWLYNYKPIRSEVKIENSNDLVHDENTNEVEEKKENDREEQQQEGSFIALASANEDTSVVIINDTPEDENNLKADETNSAIVILDTVLESEEIEMRNKSDDEMEIPHEGQSVQMKSNEIERNSLPVPAPRTSLIKNDELSDHSSRDDDIELEIVVNNEKSDEPPKLRLEIINPDEMINDIRKEIDQILIEAQERINSQDDEETLSPDDDFASEDENVFQNQSFLTHLSDVITKSPMKRTQTLHRAKSNEKSESFKRSKSYHTIDDAFRISAGNEENFKIEPLADIKIPGTPVSSRHLRENSLKLEASKNIHGTPVTSIREVSPVEINKNYTQLSEVMIEKVEEKNDLIKADINSDEVTKEPERKLPNFKIQSSTSAVATIIKSPELPPENKNDFKEKLARLLSNPPTNVLNFKPIPRERTEKTKPTLNEEHSSNVTVEKSEPETPKKIEQKPKAITPFAMLTETMNRQKKLFDEVLKTIKNKSDEHANDNK